MSALDGVDIGLGALLVAVTLYDVFQSVVLPRPAVGRVRLSTTFVEWCWRGWRRVAERPRTLQMREAALATFAPMMIVVLLVMWAFFVILGFALIFFGLRVQLHPQPDSFPTALYFSAGTMLSFVVDGIDSVGVAARTFSTVEAATGFGLFALVISLLFSLFQSFQRRETAVVALDALGGAPPSGVQILERCLADNMPEQLVATFDEWRAWTVDVLESHLSYPLLFYFRSSHDNEAWANSFGAVMDAATLVLSAIDDVPVGHARLMYKVGIHLVADMRSYFKYIDRADNPGVEREEFTEACGRLQRSGYRLHDPETAWHNFSELRTRYAAWLNETTKYLGVPPAPWIGDRSYLPHREKGRAGVATGPPP